MRAVIKNSSEKTLGNLIWMPPYLYPEDELEESVGTLRELGYWISFLPEGDGLCFKHETKDDIQVFNDFRIHFPWMTIQEYPIDAEFDYQKDIFNYQLVILPLSRLNIENILHAGKFSIYPAYEFPLSKLNIKPSISSLRNYITDLTKASEEVFESCPLIIFTTDSIDYTKYNQMDQTQDEVLIKQLSKEADEILDLVRYYDGDYFHPEFMIANAGLWNEKYSAALIHFTSINVSHIQAREVEVKTFIKSIGGEITQAGLIEVNPLLNFPNNETGNIARHALRLNSAILESDDLTIKFSSIMTLLEYLAFPYEYEKFQLVKKKIALHVAHDIASYQVLMQRFEELTAGLKKQDGSGDRDLGLRTSIVHLGKRLEQLVSLKEDQKNLFRELQSYTRAVINDMITHSDLSWVDFEKEREKLKLNLGI